MKTKIYFPLLFMAIILASCHKNNEAQQSVSITPEILSKGEASPRLDNGNFVVNNTTDWNNLLTNLSQGVNIDYVFTTTNVDFSQWMVIAIIDVGYPTGGWSVDITDVTETAHNIEVNYTHLNTGDDTLMPLQPYQVVKIPISNKPVVFIQN